MQGRDLFYLSSPGEFPAPRKAHCAAEDVFSFEKSGEGLEKGLRWPKKACGEGKGQQEIMWATIFCQIPLPSNPPEAPAWIQWFIWAIVALVIATLGVLYLLKSRKVQNQDIHKSTVADLNEAIKARDIRLKDWEVKYAAQGEVLAQAETELGALAGINQKEVYLFSGMMYQQKLRETEEKYRILKDESDELARRVRYCDRHHGENSGGKEAHSVVRK